MVRTAVMTVIGLAAWLALAVGGVALAEDRFTDNKDGTVTDHQLGVMWAKSDNQGDIDWRQARQWIQFTFPYTISKTYDNWRDADLEGTGQPLSGRQAGRLRDRLRAVGSNNPSDPAFLRLGVVFGHVGHPGSHFQFSSRLPLQRPHGSQEGLPRPGRARPPVIRTAHCFQHIDEPGVQ